MTRPNAVAAQRHHHRQSDMMGVPQKEAAPAGNRGLTSTTGKGS